jgi:mercuric ion binding protein
MKLFRIIPVMAICFALAGTIAAQTTTESFNVSGNCGMCKTKIEKAAKDAGATTASWNVEAKTLTVTYNSSTTNTAKIQQKIADVGYDNAGFTAKNEAYEKLHACCKYDRVAADTHTAKMKDCKDGKMDCCKKGDSKMDCCKDGKCTKAGHDGKDCCKKAE